MGLRTRRAVQVAICCAAPVLLFAGCLGGAKPASTSVMPTEAWRLECGDPCADMIAGPGRVHEPMIAIDPRDSSHMVLAVNEVAAGEAASVAYVTFDAGATWTRSRLPRTVGGNPVHPEPNRAWQTDPVALILRDGTVLYATLAGDGMDPPRAAGITVAPAVGVHLDVARSEDGGRTFNTTTRIASGYGMIAIVFVPGASPVPAGTFGPDKEWMAEAPDGSVLMVWTQYPSAPAGAEVQWSASRDAGRTWSPPARIDGPSGQFAFATPAFGNDGAWHVAYIHWPQRANAGAAWCCMETRLATSRDHGATWRTTTVPLPANPEGIQFGLAHRDGKDRLVIVGTVALDTQPAGMFDFTRREQLLATWSDDGGATWSNPLSLDEPSKHPGALVPAAAFADDATFYVSFYSYATSDRMERRLIAVQDGAVRGRFVLDADIPGPATLPDRLGDYMGIALVPGGTFNVWVNEAQGRQGVWGTRVEWREAT